MTRRAALGFAPHSGWAAVVVLGGDASEPAALTRDRIEMADPALAGSRQPYHEVEGWPVAKARDYLALLSGSARSMAAAALGPLLRRVEELGYRAVSAGILESAGRKGLPLESVLASHALIHTADGEHFREALERAGQACGLVVSRVPQRDLPTVAAGSLRRPAGQLQASVGAFGRSLGPPWGADQKAAALLAWMLLAAPLSAAPPRERSGTRRPSAARAR